MRPGSQTLFERRDGEVRVEYARDLGATGREEPRLLCDAVPVMCTGGRNPLGWVVTKSELRLLAMRASSEEDRGGRKE